MRKSIVAFAFALAGMCEAQEGMPTPPVMSVEDADMCFTEPDAREIAEAYSQSERTAIRLFITKVLQGKCGTVSGRVMLVGREDVGSRVHILIVHDGNRVLYLFSEESEDGGTRI